MLRHSTSGKNVSIAQRHYLGRSDNLLRAGRGRGVRPLRGDGVAQRSDGRGTEGNGGERDGLSKTSHSPRICRLAMRSISEASMRPSGPSSDVTSCTAKLFDSYQDFFRFQLSRYEGTLSIPRCSQ